MLQMEKVTICNANCKNAENGLHKSITFHLMQCVSNQNEYYIVVSSEIKLKERIFQF